MTEDIKKLLWFILALFILWFIFVFLPGKTDQKALNDRFIKVPENIEPLETYDKKIDLEFPDLKI